MCRTHLAAPHPSCAMIATPQQAQTHSIYATQAAAAGLLIAAIILDLILFILAAEQMKLLRRATQRHPATPIINRRRSCRGAIGVATATRCVWSGGRVRTMASPPLTTSVSPCSPCSSVSPWRDGLRYCIGYAKPELLPRPFSEIKHKFPQPNPLLIKRTTSVWNIGNQHYISLFFQQLYFF